MWGMISTTANAVSAATMANDGPSPHGITRSIVRRRNRARSAMRCANTSASRRANTSHVRCT